LAIDVEADSIIQDPKQDPAILARKLHLHVPRLTMRNDVMQRFLRDTI